LVFGDSCSIDLQQSNIYPTLVIQALENPVKYHIASPNILKYNVHSTVASGIDNEALIQPTLSI